MSRWVNILEWLDEKAFIGMGLALTAVGFVALLFSIIDVLNVLHVFSLSLVRTVLVGVSTVVVDILLVLVIFEIMGTVVHHLRDGETTLRPFLFIVIIAAIRVIFAIDASFLSGQVSAATNAWVMPAVVLGLNILVIISMSVSMKLIGTYLEEGAIPRRGRPTHTASLADDNDLLNVDGD